MSTTTPGRVTGSEPQRSEGVEKFGDKVRGQGWGPGRAQAVADGGRCGARSGTARADSCPAGVQTGLGIGAVPGGIPHGGSGSFWRTSNKGLSRSPKAAIRLSSSAASKASEAGSSMPRSTSSQSSGVEARGQGVALSE